MAILLNIAAWVLVLVGFMVVVLVASYLLDRLIREILRWRNVWRTFIDFCLNRHKCTCGAVWAGPKPEGETTR